jgi:hypothetical protein
MSKPATHTTESTELSERELEAFESVANTMESAEYAIDSQFGAGFAEKHPELIGDYLQAVAITYQADTVGAKLDQVLGELEGMKPTIAEVIHG